MGSERECEKEVNVVLAVSCEEKKDENCSEKGHVKDLFLLVKRMDHRQKKRRWTDNKIKVDWKTDDTTGTKRKGYEEISNAVKIIVAVMRGARPVLEPAAPA